MPVTLVALRAAPVILLAVGVATAVVHQIIRQERLWEESEPAVRLEAEVVQAERGSALACQEQTPLAMAVAVEAGVVIMAAAQGLTPAALAAMALPASS